MDLETFLRPDLFVAYLFTSSNLMMSAALAWIEDFAEAANLTADEGADEDSNG